MLAGLTLVANASHYWLGSWFDVEPTHGDKMADMHTTERGGRVWVWEVDASSWVICVFIWEMRRYVSVWVPDECFVKRRKKQEWKM